jgi:hydrogenase maturation protein HypF
MSSVAGEQRVARRVHVRGIVQGVGFRPFVFRLAQAHALAGWVHNGDDGVSIHIQGGASAVDAFVRALTAEAPPAAVISALDVTSHEPLALEAFEIRESTSTRPPTTRMSPDLPVCDDCLRELFDPGDRRFRYPYINCTNCGPRFSIVRALPYDRARTTMAGWRLCEPCASEYGSPADRRFHAQPVACPACGPEYLLVRTEPRGTALHLSADPIREAARLLRDGRVVGVKGIGGYHLACDADNPAAVTALRERKFRKEKPFALMVRTLAVARRTVKLSALAEQQLRSVARPIVLCAARDEITGVAPGIADLGVMLPYAPLHHLLFDSGAPDRLVMTSGNRSNEPIAYRDDDAVERLAPMCDAILVGERPIGRRVDDSVVRVDHDRAVVLRRSRGYAPCVVAKLPTARPVLAVGADLKNTVTLAVGGEAWTSQHIGDLEHYDALVAFREAVDDLLTMYGIHPAEAIIAHDLHPEYGTTAFAKTLQGVRLEPVQHHRAHIASVLAEAGELHTRVVGVAFDGTGYGDDGTIWGGEFFVGSVRDGFTRVAHLRPARLPGGDAAARFPVQAAAGFLSGLDDMPDLTAPPFSFPRRYCSAQAQIARDVRSFSTTSAGRLFDAVAALAGFTREISYEGQAAIWLEQLARSSSASDAYSIVWNGTTLDWSVALQTIIKDRRAGEEPAVIARRFHHGLAQGTAMAAIHLARAHHVDAVALSGGVFQNALLLNDVIAMLKAASLRVLTNAIVPPNDGGISLGQATIAAAAVCA